MKLIELHILQTFPVSCLNRDDLNSPKTAIFGGVNRARVSSQSWKRAIRLRAKELSSEKFGGIRTKYIKELIKSIINDNGKNSEDYESRINEAIGVLTGSTIKKENKKKNTDTEKSQNDNKKTDTILFISQKEAEEIANIVLDSTADITKEIKSLLKDGTRDLCDIAIFGRMMASNNDVNVEAAGMFSHAISTHKVENDIDFFVAVDDNSPLDQTGSGHIGTLEFNSATYYRYIALNLDLLKSNTKNCLNDVEFKEAIEIFIRACIEAVPNARKNSMNAYTLPDYVLGIVKENGQPLQLVNAFESPIKRDYESGIKQKSQNKLEEHLKSIKETWGIENLCEVSIPQTNFKEFLNTLLSNV